MKIRMTNQIGINGKIYVGKLITTLHHEQVEHGTLIIADNTEEAGEKFQSWATEEFPSRDSSQDKWEISIALVII